MITSVGSGSARTAAPSLSSGVMTETIIQGAAERSYNNEYRYYNKNTKMYTWAIITEGKYNI